jgi:hypothetical protein
MQMKLIRFVGPAMFEAGMVIVPSVAAADSAGLDTTGPNSTQQIRVDNTAVVVTTNKNDVQAVNVNDQKAESGKVLAANNTAVGSAAGANASNENSANTEVKINSEGAVQTPVPGTGGGSGAGGSTGGGAPGSGSGQPGSGGGAPAQGGEALGAATTPGMGAGELPVTGPTDPVDVSALRAAWHPQAGTTASQPKQTSAFSTLLLLAAALLCLAGAIGSRVYARRLERRE